MVTIGDSNVGGNDISKQGGTSDRLVVKMRNILFLLPDESKLCLERYLL